MGPNPGAGSLAGGWLSGLLIKRGAPPARARMAVMPGCACWLPFSPWIVGAAVLNTARVPAVVTVFAARAWLINISSLVVDIVPRHSLGAVFSVAAAGSTIGGILMNMLVGAMVSGAPAKTPGFLDSAVRSTLGGLLESVEGAGYGQWFVVKAFLHPVAWLLLRAGRAERP